MKKAAIIFCIVIIIATLLFIIIYPQARNVTPEIKEEKIENDDYEIIEKENKQITEKPKVKVFTPSNITTAQKQIIAHAGGSLYISGEKYTYTNCYKAIKNSYNQGTRLCEIDFLCTKDGKQVAFHSWDGFLTKFFNVESKEDYTYDEFMSFSMIDDAGQLDLDRIMAIMKSDFPELILVTDTKDNNEILLTEIKEEYSDMMVRIIPQVYNQDEYKKAKELGYENIIYTLYQSPDTDDVVIEFCKNNQVFAITMPNARATEEFVGKLKDIGVYVYTHTVDKLEDFEYLRKMGVDGIYTNDLLDPSKL